MEFKRLLQILSLSIFLWSSSYSYADEGMWLLQLLEEQHSIELMQKEGLLLEAESIYSPDKVSLKDAVGIFGGGCTGEIISSEGLILTNHHCGYSFIQQHSTVQKDYLRNGFWAYSKSEELPTPGLTFTCVERIVNVTDIVNSDILNGNVSETEALTRNYLDSLSESQHKNSDLYGKPGIYAQTLPYFAGNQYYLVYMKRYTDVRMVAAPPTSIGKFGGETDNWMWPRHTGDFSLFRIYADSIGEPVSYDPNNIPLRAKKFFPISLKGFNEGDFTMILGFPGNTERYLTASEIRSLMENENSPRIQVRETRQNILKEAMATNDSIQIMYASKYARSSNYWKNSIGMNRAIEKNKTLELKLQQEKDFQRFADSIQHSDFQTVIDKIDRNIQESGTNRYEQTLWYEVFYSAIEFGSPHQLFEEFKLALKEKNLAKQDSLTILLWENFHRIHNKDYDHNIDRNVAKEILPLYEKMNKDGDLPSFYNTIVSNYKGNYNEYIDDLYAQSIFSSEENFRKFLRNPSIKTIDKDLMNQFDKSKWEKYQSLTEKNAESQKELSLLQKKYIQGLCEMNGDHPQYPDANFTLRLSYGTINSYNPADAIHYNYFTTLEGVMEKEDPTNPEFVVPEELKELYRTKNYGRYALPSGKMPVNFISNNDITGGNSGSPVINANGELIGCAFDGNWESLSGDIQFNEELQRSICVDIRYILFIIDKLGKCPHLINEMKLIE